MMDMPVMSMALAVLLLRVRFAGGDVSPTTVVKLSGEGVSVTRPLPPVPVRFSVCVRVVLEGVSKRLVLAATPPETCGVKTIDRVQKPAGSKGMLAVAVASEQSCPESAGVVANGELKPLK
jgi:hypothetical protein